MSSGPLGVRELACLERLARGMTQEEIAADLNISVHTVKGHKRQIFRKLKASNKAHAVAIGYRTGLLNGDEPIEEAA